MDGLFNIIYMPRNGSNMDQGFVWSMQLLWVFGLNVCFVRRGSEQLDITIRVGPCELGVIMRVMT